MALKFFLKISCQYTVDLEKSLFVVIQSQFFMSNSYSWFFFTKILIQKTKFWYRHFFDNFNLENNLLLELCSQNIFQLENWLHYEIFLSNSVDPVKRLPSPIALYEMIAVIILTLCNRRSIFSLDMYCNPKWVMA